MSQRHQQLVDRVSGAIPAQMQVEVKVSLDSGEMLAYHIIPLQSLHPFIYLFICLFFFL